jgi:hypothetical protein
MRLLVVLGLLPLNYIHLFDMVRTDDAVRQAMSG